MKTVAITILVTFFLTGCNGQSMKNLYQEHNKQIKEEVEKEKQKEENPH